MLKSTDCPESEGFKLELTEIVGSDDTVTDSLEEAMLLPELSSIFRVKLAVPVPDAVHVGLLTVVEEKDPDAPLSLHEYEYVPSRFEDVSPRVIVCPTSIEDWEVVAVTVGEKISRVPDSEVPSIDTVHVQSVPLLEP